MEVEELEPRSYEYKISPLSAMLRAGSYGWGAVEDSRHNWRKPNNSKRKTLRTHRRLR